MVAEERNDACSKRVNDVNHADLECNLGYICCGSLDDRHCCLSIPVILVLVLLSFFTLVVCVFVFFEKPKQFGGKMWAAIKSSKCVKKMTELTSRKKSRSQDDVIGTSKDEDKDADKDGLPPTSPNYLTSTHNQAWPDKGGMSPKKEKSFEHTPVVPIINSPAKSPDKSKIRTDAKESPIQLNPLMSSEVPGWSIKDETPNSSTETRSIEDSNPYVDYNTKIFQDCATSPTVKERSSCATELDSEFIRSQDYRSIPGVVGTQI